MSYFIFHSTSHGSQVLGCVTNNRKDNETYDHQIAISHHEAFQLFVIQNTYQQKFH